MEEFLSESPGCPMSVMLLHDLRAERHGWNWTCLKE